MNKDYEISIKNRFWILLIAGSFLLSACGSEIDSDIYKIDIEQEISEYRQRFIDLYTSNALDDTESQMNIEEIEIDYDGDNGEPVTLIKYTDSHGEVLRCQLHFYGETMHTNINYYFCKDFVWISKECDYYSSWILTAGYSDVLYSNIENWIVFDDIAYILHDDGELEEIEKMQMGIPLIEEIQQEEAGESAGTEEKKEVKQDVDFEIIKESYHYNEQRNDINIYYPQLMGLEDKAKEERINALIETEAKKLIGEKNKEGDDTLYCLDLDYEVKFLNNRVISIFYKGNRGYIMPGRARMPRIVLATTIDLEEEKVIALKDVADISKLGDMLLSDEFENITMWEGEISEIAASTVIYIHDEGVDVDLEERHQWYTDGDNFIIVLVDTRLYAYLEYSIDIESVSHILDETFIKKLQDAFKGNDMVNQDIAEKDDFGDTYRILNTDFFGNETLIPWFQDEIKREINDYAESVKGDLTEVWEEDSIIPRGLVIEMEKMIYQSLDKSMDKINWEELQQSIYFETMRKLGEEKWHPDLEEMKILFPELNEDGLELDSVYDAYSAASGNEYCYDLFHVPTPDSDNYLLAIDSGGSAGICYLVLTELVNHELVKISEFETKNAGYGRVVQYEDDFYYIFLENNYSMKIYDGVRVYKLGENMEYENLQIKYLPYAYTWENLYNTREGQKWELYIESIKGEIDSNEYLIDGTNERECRVYFGDEEEVEEDFIVPENEERYSRNTYHQIDFTNAGVPIYMRKSNFYPSNTHTTWHATAMFYLRNLLDGSIVTLDNMELDPNPLASVQREPAIVQMWFKKMDGKVYTFCMYHVSDYNYMLNVVRFEGNQANRIRTDILLPQRGFVLVEGERYNAM